MSYTLGRWSPSPAVVRGVPFVGFVLLTSLQGTWGEGSRYWLYLLKTILGTGCIWLMRTWVKEMRWSFSPLAVGAGVLVFLLWVGLDGCYPSLDTVMSHSVRPLLGKLGMSGMVPEAAKPSALWNPHAAFPESPALAWGFVVVRLAGSALVVPPLEEVFYRSFLYRYLAKPDFESIPLGALRWGPLFLTAAVFGFSHFEWLPGILCGLIYQALVCRTKRLGDAITAHAITNLLLGLWIVARGDWHYW